MPSKFTIYKVPNIGKIRIVIYYKRTLMLERTFLKVVVIVKNMYFSPKTIQHIF